MNVEPFPGEDIGQSRGPSLGEDVLNFHFARFSLLDGHHSPSFGEDPLDDFMAPIPKLLGKNIEINDQYDVGISRLAGLFGDDHILFVPDLNDLGFIGYERQLGESDRRESLDLKFGDLETPFTAQ